MGFFDGIRKGNDEETQREGEYRRPKGGFGAEEERKRLLGWMGNGRSYGGYTEQDRRGEWGYGGGFMDGEAVEGSESSARAAVHREDCEGQGQCGIRRRSGE